MRVLQIASENASGTTDSFGLPTHFEQNWFDFIQAKFKMLDALEESKSVQGYTPCGSRKEPR